ncbi:MAG TPA: thioredoxin domain-containing protein [Blastocatellia bacterium]|nr:thioredoxin domain-containing protein [Blastocatellia bacterium]
MSEHKFTNKLINETSPYLLQHAHNPVDWYPWGEEALSRAREEDKPILLSIGYSACHWCHVMEHESFENEQIAELMNDNFINIKVDREERPDLDQIYMNAVQAMTGHGGWPMTVFLTPKGEPFYGGTYFPPEDRHNMPGFPRLLLGVADAYQNRRNEIEKGANELLNHLNGLDAFKPSEAELNTDVLDNAARALEKNFDHTHGGFGHAPKFPPSMTLMFLLRNAHRTGNETHMAMIELTLDKMARGGMYDQLGGGFHRYSVDERWLVPHFEKMLYDNALLARIYLYAFQATGKPFYRRVVEETLDYVIREMTDASGGFYSTQDADSEGHEGKFFVWSPAQINEALGEEDDRLVSAYYGVTERGNFEGRNILYPSRSLSEVAKETGVTVDRLVEAIDRGRKRLFELREKRIKPGRDEKILTAWNGLMLTAFSEASRALDRDDYRQVAIRNAEFVLSKLTRDGKLLRTYKDSQAKLNGYLEDYAYVVEGLLAVYEATFDVRWFEGARNLADTMICQFEDESKGGFFFTGKDHETLITRNKDYMDNAIPSGNSVAANALLRLSLLTANESYKEKIVLLFRIMREPMNRYPSAFGYLLCALDFYLSSPREIALIGERGDPTLKAMIEAVFSEYNPNVVVASASSDDSRSSDAIALLKDRPQIDGKVTAYVCQEYTCLAPVTSVDQLIGQLKAS